MNCKSEAEEEKPDLLKKVKEKLSIELQSKPHLFHLFDEIVLVEPLGVKEAIGDPAPYRDFALQRGEERLIEAAIKGSRGQAFTSYPCRWRGTLNEVLNLSLDSEKNRAIFVAATNALGHLLALCDRTIHCKDQGPDKCSSKIAEYIASISESDVNVGIVGYQPAIIKYMAALFGSDRVYATDLNPQNIGKEVFGVKILDGSTSVTEMAKNCHVVLITGSTVVNGTLNQLLDVFKEYGVKPYLYGTTAAAFAKFLGMERLCFEAT